jgi:hypothetical protein
LRALHYIKANYPRDVYHATWAHLFNKFWTPPNLNLTKEDVLAEVLSELDAFSPQECDKILAAAKSNEAKDALTKATKSALDKGAFGAPWLWVRNGKGEAEPFFGSDRYLLPYPSRRISCGWTSCVADARKSGSTTSTSTSACLTRTSPCCPLAPGPGCSRDRRQVM